MAVFVCNVDLGEGDNEGEDECVSLSEAGRRFDHRSAAITSVLCCAFKIKRSN